MEQQAGAAIECREEPVIIILPCAELLGEEGVIGGLAAPRHASRREFAKRSRDALRELEQWLRIRFEHRQPQDGRRPHERQAGLQCRSDRRTCLSVLLSALLDGLGSCHHAGQHEHEHDAYGKHRPHHAEMEFRGGAPVASASKAFLGFTRSAHQGACEVPARGASEIRPPRTCISVSGRQHEKLCPVLVGPERSRDQSAAGSMTRLAPRAILARRIVSSDAPSDA